MKSFFSYLSYIFTANMYMPYVSPPIVAIDRLRDTSVTSTAESKTFAAGGTLIKLGATDYDIFIRWLTETDTTAVSATNFSQFVKAGTAEYFLIPEGKTGISYFSPSGTAILQLIVQ